MTFNIALLVALTLCFSTAFPAAFTTAKLLLLLALIPILAWRVNQQKIQVRFHENRFYFLSILIAFFVTTLASDFSQTNFVGWCSFFGYYLIYLLFRESFVRSPERKVFVWKTVVLLGLFQIAIGISQTIILRDPGRIRNLGMKQTFVGSIGNSEYLAFFLSMCLLAVTFQSKIIQNNLTRWLTWLMLAGGILCTESRLSVLSLLLIFLFSFFRSRSNHKFALASAGAGIFLLSVWFGISHREMLQQLLDTQSIRGRLLYSIAALNIIKNTSLIGTGFGGFQTHLFSALGEVLSSSRGTWISNASGFTDRVHNEYLDLLLEGGLFLMIPLSLMSIRLIGLARDSKDTFNFSSLVFILLMFIGSFPMHVIPNALLILIILADVNSKNQVSALEPPNHDWPVKGCAILISAMSFTLFACISFSELTHKQVQQLVASSNLNLARVKIDRGLSINPAASDLRLELARILYMQFHNKEALQELDKIESQKISVDSCKLRGLIFLSQKDYHSAIHVYKLLAKSFPNMITPHFYLARIYLRTGESETAKKYLQDVAHLTALNEKAQWDKALARSQMNRQEAQSEKTTINY